jgi:hypothetical protein
MAAILAATEAILRTANDWDSNSCSIQPGSEPPPTAAQWYIAIDDAGVEQSARAEDYYLREQFVIEIGVWRRPGQLPHDRKKELQKNVTRYMNDMLTLEPLERKVIKALHKSQTWRNTLNSLAGFPEEGSGDQVVNPLVYQGRSKNETLVFGKENEHAFFGRRLRFRGGDRVQTIESMQ